MLLLIAAAVSLSACHNQSASTSDMGSSACSSSPLWTAHSLGQAVGAYWAIWGSVADDIYVVGNQTVVHSKDRGTTWTAAGVQAQTLSDFQTVWGSASDDVYIGGGSIWHSTDAGLSWTKLQWPVLTVWGLSRQDLFGQTAAGLMHSSDGGTSWTSSFGARVLNVWGTSSTDLYLSSDFGSVFHSSDDGASWQMVLAGGAAGGAVAFGGTHGSVYAVGGSILKSVDDGQHWTALALPTLTGSLNLRSLWTDASGSDVFAVGQADNGGTASGIIMHSTDGGASWSIELQCPTAVLTAIWGAAPTDVYAVGELNAALHRME